MCWAFEKGCFKSSAMVYCPQRIQGEKNKVQLRQSGTISPSRLAGGAAQSAVLILKGSARSSLQYHILLPSTSLPPQLVSPQLIQDSLRIMRNLGMEEAGALPCPSRPWWDGEGYVSSGMCVLLGRELLELAGLRIGEHLRHDRCQGRGAC